MKQPHVSIGILTYNSEKYLEHAIPSFLAQDYPNLEIVVLDNNSSDNTVSILQERYPEVQVITSKENLGFSKGHNRLIRETNGDFYLCTNIDLILEPNFVSKLVDIMEQHPDCASATGKLLRWNFEKFQKTNIIDSTGLGVKRPFTFFDRGQGELDQGQFDSKEQILGCSAAVALYRTSALDKVALQREQKEYFDEIMFMYKEDIDLALRLQIAGFSAYYTPEAIGYHDRTATKGSFWGRKKAKSPQVRQQSYTNQRLLEYTYLNSKYSFYNKLKFKSYSFLRSCYLNCFEPDLKASHKRLGELRQILANKKDHIQKQSPEQLERWFS